MLAEHKNRTVKLKWIPGDDHNSTITGNQTPVTNQGTMTLVIYELVEYVFELVESVVLLATTKNVSTSNIILIKIKSVMLVWLASQTGVKPSPGLPKILNGDFLLKRKYSP